MAKKSYSVKKAKSSVFTLLAIVAGVLLISVILPALIPNGSGIVKTVVDFFLKVRDHFTDFWMFYSFILVVVLAYFAKKK